MSADRGQMADVPCQDRPVPSVNADQSVPGEIPGAKPKEGRMAFPDRLAQPVPRALSVNKAREDRRERYKKEKMFDLP